MGPPEGGGVLKAFGGDYPGHRPNNPRSLAEGISRFTTRRRSSVSWTMFSIFAAFAAVCSVTVSAEEATAAKDVIGGGSGAVPRSFPTPAPSSILSQSHPSPIHPLPPVTSLLPSSNSPSIFPGAPPHLLPPASPFQAPPPPPSIAHIPPPSLSSGPHPPIVVAPAPHSVVAPVDVAPASIEYEGGTQPFPHDTDPVPTGPMYFATENSTTVTAQIGSTALVPCVVRNIGDGMVSWIRRKDYHLLTVGLTTYSSDERYSAVHAQHSEDWTLQIKYVQERDAGLYECQVSSHPPTSIFIDLRVVEARADILGPSEKYLKSGSMLRLSCVLRQSTEPPVYVFWYHNNRMINYDRDRGVNVTSPVLSSTAGGSGATTGEGAEEGGEGATAAVGSEEPSEEEHASTLVIASAQKAHSGNYSCVPNNAQPASTYVHILNAGENPAAMQHGGRGLSWLRCPSAWLLAACLVASLSPSWQRSVSPLPTATGGASPRRRPGHPKPCEPWKKRRKSSKVTASRDSCERRSRLKSETRETVTPTT